MVIWYIITILMGLIFAGSLGYMIKVGMNIDKEVKTSGHDRAYVYAQYEKNIKILVPVVVISFALLIGGIIGTNNVVSEAKTIDNTQATEQVEETEATEATVEETEPTLVDILPVTSEPVEVEDEPTVEMPSTNTPAVTVKPTEPSKPVPETPTEPEPETPEVPETPETPETPSETPSEPVEDETESSVDPDALEMLACVIYQEVGGDAYCDECRYRVADVVLNRVASPNFPDTIYGVLTQRAQYGRFHWTGIVWPARASWPGEKHAVERAYRIAEDILNGNHSELYGQGYVWQAEFVQGSDGFWHCGHFFGR